MFIKCLNKCKGNISLNFPINIECKNSEIKKIREK